MIFFHIYGYNRSISGAWIFANDIDNDGTHELGTADFPSDYDDRLPVGAPSGRCLIILPTGSWVSVECSNSVRGAICAFVIDN